MKTLIAAGVMSVAMLAGGAAPAEAGGIHIGIGHRGHNHGYYGRSSGYYNYNYGGYRPQWNRGYGGYGYVPRHTWHDTSHYDYHPGYVVPHGNHYDVVPGHYDWHQTGHLHHNH